MVVINVYLKDMSNSVSYSVACLFARRSVSPLKASKWTTISSMSHVNIVSASKDKSDEKIILHFDDQKHAFCNHN